MNKVLVLKYEKGYFSPKILIQGRGEEAHKILSLASNQGISIKKDSDLLKSLWNSSSEKQEVEEEVISVLSDFLYCIYEIEKRNNL